MPNTYLPSLAITPQTSLASLVGEQGVTLPDYPHYINHPDYTGHLEHCDRNVGGNSNLLSLFFATPRKQKPPSTLAKVSWDKVPTSMHRKSQSGAMKRLKTRKKCKGGKIENNNKRKDNGIVVQNAPPISNPRCDTKFDICLCAPP
jgi:hypothetical protein